MPLSPPLGESPEEVRALLAPLRHPFSVALHTAGNAFAVGAVIRVAHNFLAREVILLGEAPFYEKASMGMEKYESIVSLAGEAELLEYVGERPVFAVEKDFASLYDVQSFPNDVVFLFGSERFGLTRETCDACDDVLGIPIYGVNQSLPLAVAAGIVMNAWAERHARSAR